MSLSYLVEEHNDDLLLEAMTIMTDDSEQNDNPFDIDVPSTSSNEGSSIDVRETTKSASSNIVLDKPYAITTKPLITPNALVGSASSISLSLPPQQRRHQMRGTPTNEIGDLPALSKRASDQDLAAATDRHGKHDSVGVTGGRGRRVRPLSPPSRAGLDDPDAYHEHFVRSRRRTTHDDYSSDSDEDDEGTDVYSRSNTTFSRNSPHFASIDEMPMDERREFAKEQAERRLEALAMCTGGDDAASNFCESTFGNMNDWCSSCSLTKNKSGSPIAKRNLVLGDKQSIRQAGGVEEQTAIEVEYVEPIYRGKNGDDELYSPKRKNALLRAMARRAKDDYQKNSIGKTNKQEARDSSPTTGDASSHNGGVQVSSTQANENVYASFSPSEKRKFLKLINGGMTPFNATSQVMKERLEAEESKSLASSNDGLPVAGGELTAVAHGVAVAGSPSDKRKKESEPTTPKRRGLAFWKRGKDKSSIKIPEEESEAIRKKSSTWTLKSSPPDSSRAVSPATPPQALDRQRYRDSDDDDGNEIVEGFARSGINYYDAVRWDRSNEDLYDDEEEVEDDGRKNLSKSKRSSKKFPKMGFSKLAKSESNEGEFAPVIPREHASHVLVEVEPHVTIPSPVLAASSEEGGHGGEEEFRSLATSPNMSESYEETHDLLRPIPFKPESADYDRRIPPSLSGDSLLTEEGMEEKKEEEQPLFRNSDQGDQMEAAMTATLLGVPNPRSLEERLQQTNLTEESPKPSVELDIDTYLNSTQTVTQLGNASTGSFDHASVVSGKSFKTSQTAGTNFTQSTRTRRPGQGKVRLQKEKSTQQQKLSGWQESIRAAAASSGRVWDPEYGWKDYFDPKIVGTEEQMGIDTSDLIHLPVDRFRKRAEDDDSLLNCENESGTRLTRKPFPPDWDGQPSCMLREEHAGMERSLAPSTPSRRTKNPKVLTPKRDDKPRGWKETMKVATSNISANGKRWDPERGWIGPDGEEIQMTVDLEEERVEVVASSDTQDFGTLNAVAIRTIGPGVLANHRESSVEQLEAIADMNQDSGHQFLSEDEEQVTDEDLRSVSRSMESKYMQIKDTGSVQSHDRNPSKSELVAQPQRLTGQAVAPEESPHKDSRNALLTDPSPSTKEMFANMEEAHGEGEPLQVVREELDQKDEVLFRADNGSKSQRRSGPIDLDEIYDEEMNAMQDVLSQSEMEPPEGDELFEQETNDSFGEAQDFSWDEDDAKVQAATNHKPVPRLKINIREPVASPSGPWLSKSGATASEVSFGSSSTSSRSIPKLRGPKRDSSPIHAGRRSGMELSNQEYKPRRDPDMVVSTLSPQPMAECIDSFDDDQGGAEFQLEDDRAPDPPGSSEPAIVTPEKEAVEESAPQKPRIQSVEPDEQQKSTPLCPVVNKPSDDSEPTSVKSLHDYWEARARTPPNAQSAEWKTFLAKKIKAESAAASSMKQKLKNEEKDSIFDFHGSEGYFHGSSSSSGKATRGLNRKPGEPQVGAFDDISDLSPIRHEESDSDFVPSEASTQIVHGTTFLQRLQACAAPIVTKSNDCGPSVPMAAHLAFLRSNPSVGSTPDKHDTDKTSGSRRAAQSPALCGRPDVIVEEEDEENDSEQGMGQKANFRSVKPEKSRSRSRSNTRSRSNPRSTRSKDDVGSVISDEFGAKTAYFEALAMKAAVSGGYKKKRRSTGSDVSGSTASRTSASSSNHSEKFQQFLDRRASKSDAPSQQIPQQQQQQQQPPQPTSMPNTKPPSGRQEISTRAERYVSEKVDEMMETMASRSNNRTFGVGATLDYRGRPMEEATGAFPTLPGPANGHRIYQSSSNSHRNNLNSLQSGSLAAAEELAAARVEAMMANLSTHKLEEDEVEI